MDYEKLKKIAEEGGYWSYAAGVAACIKEQYNIDGVEIVINKVTIREKNVYHQVQLFVYLLHVLLINFIIFI